LTPNLLNSFIKFPVSGVVGGWKELARTTLGSGSSTINVASLPNKRYYQILYNSLGQSASSDPNWTFNADTGSNYADRQSLAGGSDTTGVNQSNIFAGSQPGGDHPAFSVNYLANLSSKEKLWLSWYQAPTQDGAGEAPTRTEIVGKWTNTSDSFDEITLTSAATLTTGGEVVVLGWDPADTHTTNFWEELASENASGSSTNLSSGTITAKKYLWVQVYTDGSSINDEITFNNDSGGTTYSYRSSANGAADVLGLNGGSLRNLHTAGISGKSFSSFFIVNNASDEKLVIGQSIQQSTAGAANAPSRSEWVGKWTNTSAQITEIDVDSTSGNWGDISIIKVWGSD